MTLRHRSIRSLALVAVGALAVAACGSDDAGSAPVPDPEPPVTTSPPDPDDTDDTDEGAAITAELDGREFVATAVEGFPSSDDDGLADAPIRISFEGTSLSMSAGCNTMFGEFTFVEGRLTVDALGSTEMACDPSLMARDRWLADVIALGAAVEIDGDVVILSGVAGTRIELLDRTVAEPDLPLEDVRWVLDGIREADAVSTVPEGVVASITFSDGQALVEAGCNRGSAGVDIEADTIVFGPLGLTRMMCEPAAMEVEAAMTAVLDGLVSYSIDGDRLLVDTVDETTGDEAAIEDDVPAEMGGRGLMFLADAADLDEA